ncbi:MAG: ABC transporter ATP-binding protein/permease [Clostridium sp.]|jgi:ATP-binding cassette subfamily B protein|uniref:ABC transporter ATP-binding protein n=1 Tax=Clostridium sp. TaxID=1506 RepID=UPI0025BCC27D|nr:ABC transporter ATP-binding protein [Clostridium sp.]MCH3964100.1 ABC transporter ATP-binding protein/permease [Clostridium sp.]MCI1716301.1 ABC transporter ATP-binding protein/permease [Clostridium sp.]MCI1800459.1 ABC transporter ATP-binding protein/permease [Clostridium sp.]MCI1814478.1 ABC transporter ATP-binding protein/permease [Clostridium sp.]MCI1871377.1 ABC transporter ATP-binding protein/permease [Clostridium sp.]
MKQIFRYVFNYKGLVILPSAAMAVAIFLDMINPYLQSKIVDKVFIEKNFDLLFPILTGFVIIAVSRAVLGYVKEYIFDVLSSKVSIDMKKDLFDHIQSLQFSYFDNINTGELMSRIGEDIDNVWRSISFGIRLFIENIIYFVTTSVILLFLNWKLALICLIGMPPIACLALKFERKISQSYSKLSDQGVILNTSAQENIAGVRLVKAFAREKYEIAKFLKFNRENFDLSMEQNKIIADYFPPIDFLTNMCIVLLIAAGGIFVMKDSMTIGTLVAFSGYIWMLITPMQMLGWLVNLISQADASAKKVVKIMNIYPEIKDCENPLRLSNILGNIKFENVYFKYKDEYVLENINIEIKPGSTTAIMGTTGSGKSSIVNLIGRYYDTTNGTVYIDGHDVRKINLKDLRSKIAVVSQDTFLFSESIKENISLGNNNYSLEEIKKACELSCADEFIEKLDQKYDTVIGERGIGLSGGQKQRLSIARAIIRNSSILILDDATSALDMETEYNLLKNLGNTHKNTTKIIIAHRISAVKNADMIICLENGHIAESGSHDELLARKGRYYEIYEEQFKDFNPNFSKEECCNGNKYSKAGRES